MARRRMFTLDIVDSDAFLDMPLSTQALYFHLAMRADDDGFIGNAKKIARSIGVGDDDMKVLLAKRFVLPFESGVVVIKHWRMHNLIRKERHHETVYKKEMSLLAINENGAYTELTKLLPEANDGCHPNVTQMSDKCHTEVRLGKVRLGKEIHPKGNTEYLGNSTTPDLAESVANDALLALGKKEND